jgi:uncharacterized protein (DUF305 family)
MRITVPLLALTLALAGGVAFAQEAQDSDAMEGMDHSSMDMGDQPEHMQGLTGAMDTMMQAMPAESAGDVDADFLLMMIPHHQSAIDMARIELEQGDDEETRAMAQKVIDAQEAEIAEMRAMLERMGVGAPAE